MNKYPYIISLFLLPLFSFSQQSKIDSLLSLLKQSKEDTNKVNNLNLIGLQYANIGSYDSGMYYNNAALHLAQQLNFQQGIADSYNHIGNIYFYIGNFTEALKNDFISLRILQGENNRNFKAKITEANSFNNIGTVYQRQRKYDEASKYYFFALEIRKAINDKKGLAGSYHNIGIIYESQGKYPEALENLFAALKINEEIGNKNWKANNLVGIGIIYDDKKNYPEALKNYFNALQIYVEVNDKFNIVGVMIDIGDIYTNSNKLNEAQYYYDKALKLSIEIGSKDNIKECYFNLSNLDSTKKNWKAAFEHQRLFMLYRDSVYNEENEKKFVQAQMQYEFDKKEAAAKAEQDKKDAKIEEEKLRQKMFLFSVIGGLLLVAVFSVFMFNRWRVTQKQKKIIETQKHLVDEQKKLVEEKNKDITDSINYARRIQRAMLPHRRDIWSAFPQSFVLFKPKDIVSGDFYFFHKKDKYVFIAACDCTGHGVPGAFMSMIGSDKLEDAVLQSSDTSEILSLLNKGVKTALKQSDGGDSTRDGMDLALCSVDTENRIVKYVGANRPFWLIRKGGTAVEEIKATKKAIGGFTDDNQHFDSHEIKLNEGDTFYLSTDGYADTFGKDGKKMMTKQFKEILLGIQDKPMKEQEKHLDEFVEKWKSGTEQVDDILVIGVRL